MNNTPLTPAQANQLAESYARFVFLQNATIKQPKDDAEIKGLTEFMAQTFIDHASEFIGCQMAIRGEYEPLLNIFAQVVNRVTGIRNQALARSQQAAASEPAPSNIIPVKG